MKKHLAHLAAALAVTLLFGAAAGPLSAAAAAPTAILDEENTAAAESRLNQSWLDMEIEYDDLNPVYQLYLSSVANGPEARQGHHRGQHLHHYPAV